MKAIKAFSCCVCAYKILARLIKRRLYKYSEQSLGEYQAVLRNNSSVTAQIFVLKEIQTTCHEYKIVLHALSIDSKQAYGKIDRKQMDQTLNYLGISTDSLIEY